MVYRFGQKRLFIWGFTLTTMALFGSAGTTEILAQSLIRMIAGFGAEPVFLMGGILVAILFPREPKLNSFTAAVYFGGGGFGMFIVGLVFKNYLNNHFPNGWHMSWCFIGLASCIMLEIIIWATFQINDVHNGSELRLSGLREGIMRPAITAYFLFRLGCLIIMTFQVSWLRENGADAILTSVVWSLMGKSLWLPRLCGVKYYRNPVQDE